MRYLVTARPKPGRRKDLLEATEAHTLGQGSVAEGEYVRNINEARQLGDGRVKWVEVCYCSTPLEEERSYWQEYFELERVQDAHARTHCRDETGDEPWACGSCDCTERLEENLRSRGESFLRALRQSVETPPATADSPKPRL